MQKKPRLGQNFLIDADACRRVVGALGNIAQDAVLEIGPGRGAITRMLARAGGHLTPPHSTAGNLTLIEFDPALAAALAGEFAAIPNVEVRHADILALDLTGLSEERRRKLTIVGNLPYYITSDILLHLVAHHTAIDRAVLMVQREVAERITAPPGTSDYGVLSATMQLYGTVELLFTLPPSAFAPPPEIHSSVFRFYPRPRFEELAIAPERFVPFLRASFAQKRKTWTNNLRNAGFDTSAIAAAVLSAGLDTNVRAEAVDLERMAAVFRALHRS